MSDQTDRSEAVAALAEVLSRTFPIYADDGAGTDIDADAEAILAGLRDARFALRPEREEAGLRARFAEQLNEVYERRRWGFDAFREVMEAFDRAALAVPSPQETSAGLRDRLDAALVDAFTHNAARPGDNPGTYNYVANMARAAIRAALRGTGAEPERPNLTEAERRQAAESMRADMRGDYGG